MRSVSLDLGHVTKLPQNESSLRDRGSLTFQVCTKDSLSNTYGEKYKNSWTKQQQKNLTVQIIVNVKMVKGSFYAPSTHTSFFYIF